MLAIKPLSIEMIDLLPNALHERSAEYFKKCYVEQNNGVRQSFIAFMDEEPVGTVHLLYHSLYPDFSQNNIPEINDLSVAPDYRRQGIGEKLLNACETMAREKGYSRIGLGVGLYKGYGSAQRLYFRLGYQPDGKGLMYLNKPVIPGSSVRVDDDLLIYLIKTL
jgi:GNAT superfamily N-acetyltransferase